MFLAKSSYKASLEPRGEEVDSMSLGREIVKSCCKRREDRKDEELKPSLQSTTTHLCGQTCTRCYKGNGYDAVIGKRGVVYTKTASPRW